MEKKEGNKRAKREKKESQREHSCSTIAVQKSMKDSREGWRA